MTTIAEINAAGRLLDPDGWIDITEIATLPVEPAAPTIDPAMDCCGRPYAEHPRTDSTMRGTCHVHAGIEVGMHWNGRSYVCGHCASEAFHANRRSTP